MNKKESKKVVNSILIIIAAILCILLILIFLSADLTTTYYTYESERIPSDFNGLKIVQISDFHCKNFGKNNEKLINTIKELEPDIIFITGDSIDKFHQDLTPLENLFAGIHDIAPIYAISGNHETDDSNLYSQLIGLYAKYGIIDLDDKELVWSKGDSSIYLKGLGAFENKINWDDNFMENKHPEMFSIVLDHYPQLYSLLIYKYDMILSGHIHGGVIRIPFVGGLLGNKGEFFPEFDGGRYDLIDSTMYVNRGLGDTMIPRINNNPEIICITLKRK